jgi:two-component system, NarL family, sensor kinase
MTIPKILMKSIFCLIIAVTLAIPSSSGQTVYSLGNDLSYIARLEEEAKVANDSVKAYAYCRIALAYKRSGDLNAAKQNLAQAKKYLTGSEFLKAAYATYETLVLYLGSDLLLLEENLLRSDSLLRFFTQPEAYKLRAMIWTSYGTVQQIKGNEKDAMDAFTKKAAPFAARSGDFMGLHGPRSCK